MRGSHARSVSPARCAPWGPRWLNNPVPLVIPCHRVVRSDGTTGDYAFGAEQKTALLCGEDVDLAEVRRRSHERDSVWSEEGEDSYCYPFCFAARAAARGGRS